MHPNDSAWQAFRVSLLSPLITGETPHEDREAYFQKLAKEAHHTPDGKKTVSVRTLRRWYQTFRKQGINGLKKKRRSDLGQPRERNRMKVDRSEAHNRQLATRSDVTINKLLQAEFLSGLPASTMYRHLRIRGATKAQLGVVHEKVRCRWTRDTPNSLWMGDFSHGPQLQIRKLHRPPYEPQPGWLVERVFQTIGSQFASFVQQPSSRCNRIS